MDLNVILALGFNGVMSSISLLYLFIQGMKLDLELLMNFI